MAIAVSCTPVPVKSQTVIPSSDVRPVAFIDVIEPSSWMSDSLLHILEADAATQAAGVRRAA